MNKGILKIKYKVTQDVELQCYVPKSKYLLIKNVCINSLLTGLLTFWLMLVVQLSKQVNDYKIDICVDFLYVLFSGMFCMMIYTTIKEWYKGKDYDVAMKLVKKYTTQKEREKLLQQMPKSDIINTEINIKEETNEND